MQRNSSTYCDEPEDAADYAAWLAAFDLAARKPDIDAIIADNAFMAELQARIVPLIVQYDEFWTRYFYQCDPTVICAVPLCSPGVSCGAAAIVTFVHLCGSARFFFVSTLLTLAVELAFMQDNLPL